MNCVHRFSRDLSTNIRSVSVAMVLLVHGLLLGWMASVNAPVFDEIAHLPSGLSHWRLGNFDLYRVNPPLMRMIAAIPLLAADPKTDWTLMSESSFARSEFSVGNRFVELNGYDSFWYFTICRWAQIPVSLFGGWICYRWSQEVFGFSSGFVALVLWCFCPNILAWGSTITPDIGAAAFGVAAGYTFWRWLKERTWKKAILSGVTLGLAELTKTTWILLFPLFALTWLWCRYRARHQPVLIPPGMRLICIFLIALYLLNLGYGFERCFQKLGTFQFISHTLGGNDAHKSAGNRFRDTWIGAIPVPLPANYVMGIDVQKYDFEIGKWSYLRGEHKFGGWYHFYLYALAVKTPLGTLFVLGLASLLAAVRREYRLNFQDEVMLLMPAIAVLVLVSSQTGFNRYLRYVLPAVPFFYIFASRVGKAFELKHPVPRGLCVAAVAASVLGSLAVYPHSMSFFNSAAGGPLGGPAHLLDANIDWGQDLLELKRYIDHHPEVSPIGLAYFGVVDPKLAGFEYRQIPPSSGANGMRSDDALTPGWYAVSVNCLFGYRHYPADEPSYTHFQRFTPEQIIGYSIYVYHITCEDLAAVKKSHHSQ